MTVPDNLYDRLKKMAEKQRLSVSQLIERLYYGKQQPKILEEVHA